MKTHGDNMADGSHVRKKRKVNPLLLPGTSNDHLCAQGYITRNKSKELIENPENVENQQANADPTETDSYTDTQEPVPIPASPKGSLNVKTHGLIKQKKLRNFKCKLCEHVTTSHKKLNNHHKADHDKVACPKCDRTFNTPSTLDWHMYSHWDELKFSCDRCGKSFAFESQRRSHLVKHRKLATLKCNRSLPNGGICKKWFKRSG